MLSSGKRLRLKMDESEWKWLKLVEAGWNKLKVNKRVEVFLNLNCENISAESRAKVSSWLVCGEISKRKKLSFLMTVYFWQLSFWYLEMRVGCGGRNLIQSNRPRTHFFSVNSPLWSTNWSLSPCSTGQMIQWLENTQIQKQKHIQIQLEDRQNTNTLLLYEIWPMKCRFFSFSQC